MIPQTVPNSPMKGEAVATMASEPSPSSTLWLSRAMIESSTRSMRDSSRPAPSMAPRDRASRHSLSAACSIRGRAWRGRSPASAAMSSSARPDATCSSKRSACRRRAVIRNSLSMITVHDQIEARAKPIRTDLTTQSARMNTARAEKSLAPRSPAGTMSIGSSLSDG